MKVNHIDTNKKVLIVAEIGNNHEGDFEFAKELIYLAAEAGADAVKFQTFNTKDYISKYDLKRFEMLELFELSYDKFKILSKVAKDQNLMFISTPFDIKSAKFLENIVDVIKISSSDNNFFPLLDSICSSEKPIILSTGLLSLKELDNTIKYIETKTENIILKDKLAILHCVTAYPVENQYANLNAIKTLNDKYNITVGYSDHTLGINASIASVGIGARIIEKHFTKNNNFSNFRDHQISADPNEFRRMVESIREVEVMLGNGEKTLQKPEKKIISKVRRSIVAKRNLNKDIILTENDINWVRPGGGIPPEKTKDVIGKRLNKDLKEGQKILIKDLSN